MSYGEMLAQLNPCSPQTVTDLLAGLLPSKAHILDLGCGRGTTLQYLSKHTAFTLYGTEPDAKLLVAARIACPSASLVSTCGELIPFEDGSFDAVLIECVFSLAESPVSIASEVSRVVRRQGILLLTDLYTQGETDLLIEQTPVAGSPIAESPVAESPVSGLPATELPVAGSPVAYDPLLRHIYTKRSIDAYFTKSGFTAERFLDCTRDMQSMFAQMILDGSADSYIDAAARKGLYDAKAGYGIWIYKKI